MNLTYSKWDSDGVQVLHSITFPLGYLSKDDVYVYVGDWADYQNQLSYTWVSDTQIELTSPLAAGLELTIRRVVPRADLKYYFLRTPIIGQYLDNEHLQLLMILQEIEDGFLQVDGSTPTLGDLDMRGYKIFNLADADVELGDLAVNINTLRKYVDAQGVGGGSVISPTPPPTTVTATRWWRCTDGRAFIRVTNASGRGYWVEERAPTNPPNYEVTSLVTTEQVVNVDAGLHSKMLILTQDTTTVVLGAPTVSGVYRQNVIVFFTFTGETSCDFVPAEGVTLRYSGIASMQATNSVAAAMSVSETEWLLVGDLQREV